MGMLSRQRVLVTGAAGFIGSHLTQALAAESATVRAFVRYDSQSRLGHLERLSPQERGAIEVVRGDLKDPEAVRRAVDGCSIVFHLGALIAIPFSYQNPTDYVQTNVVGTLHVLNACLNAGNCRLIHTSTSEVYGTAKTVPITLEHPRQAQSPYSASKIAADSLVHSFARSFALPAVVLRPFNTYGPRQSPRAVIPTIVRQAIHGDVVRLGSTSPTRDFLYVDDTVRAFIAAASTELLPGTELHVGTGRETSIGDVVKLVGKQVGKELRVVTDEMRIRPDNSEVERLLCDYSVAKRLTGWSPKIPLEDGLARVIEYVQAAEFSNQIANPSEYVI